MSTSIGAVLLEGAASDARHLTFDHGSQGSRAVVRTAKVAVSWAIRAIVLGVGGIIIGIWVHGGGVTGISSLAGLLISAGRLTGLAGSYLLVLQLLALARLPFLQWAIGFDRLVIIHKLNGKMAVALIAAHVVMITAGYALMSKVSMWAQFLRFLTAYKGMVAATVATSFILLVVGTSIFIVKRRLRYESWYLVHLLAYSAVILAWFHQIPTGMVFLGNPWTAVFWTAIYILSLSLVVIFRFVQPVVRCLIHQMKVEEVVEEAPGVVSIRVTGRHLEYLNARAGQSFQWRFLDRKRWWESHPFSLSEAPDGKSFRITVKALGDFSRNAGFIRPGTRVVAEGPFGSFTTDEARKNRFALIAGGIGITPIRALLQELRHDVVLIYRASSDEDLIFLQELERLARTRGSRLFFLKGNRHEAVCRGYLSPEHLRELLPDIRDRDVYVCGPSSLMSLVGDSLRKLRVPEEQIHSDEFNF
ncbi:MAG TPA: ferredoxin reductase family protein [Chloroflexota bacterium]|nr:ferredoxin reductase family protein [Chloroflexota bacterium]